MAVFWLSGNGGWGGRYEFYLPKFEDSNTVMFNRENWPKGEPETRPIWTNAVDSIVSPVDKKPYVGSRETIWCWRADFQNDFAVPMLWTKKNYKETNHPPLPVLANGNHTSVKSGQLFHLSAAGTSDPDGDSMSYLWFNILKPAHTKAS